jgi:hypothetical protein
MKKAGCKLGLAVTLAMLAGGALALTDGEKAAAGVGERIRASDCEEAVKALKIGLKQGSDAGCAVSMAAAGDPDRFVAELQTWPQARLLRCNYIAGVMSTLSAEVQYPERALRHSVGGDVTLRFRPAVPQIDMLSGESREYQLLGIIDGNTLRDRNTKRVTGAFEKALGEVAERALRRYPQPTGIPDGTQIVVKYIFDIEFTR